MYGKADSVNNSGQPALALYSQTEDVQISAAGFQQGCTRMYSKADPLNSSAQPALASYPQMQDVAYLMQLKPQSSAAGFYSGQAIST